MWGRWGVVKYRIIISINQLLLVCRAGPDKGASGPAHKRRGGGGESGGEERGECQYQIKIPR
jgi:hypothetical protein